MVVGLLQLEGKYSAECIVSAACVSKTSRYACRSKRNETEGEETGNHKTTGEATE